MADNLDEVNDDELESHKRKRKSRNSSDQNFSRTKDMINNIKNNSATNTSSGRNAGKGSQTGGVPKGGAPTGGGAAGGATAGGGATGGGAAGGATAGGAAAGGGAGGAAAGAAAGGAAGGAAAGGAAAGGAAGGAAAGGAAAGGAAAAGGLAAVLWPIVLGILIVIGIIVVILLIIGAITFFTTVPGMMIDKITEITSGLWKGFKSYFVGNAAYITDEDQTTLAEYIENMGYDVVGYGFAAPDEVQKTTEETDAGTEEKVTVKSKYLLTYLLADYNTYALHNPIKQGMSNFWSWLWGGERPPTSGMLLIEGAISPSAEVDRDTKTLTMTMDNPQGWDFLNKDTYTYDLEGWSGRYGRPLEFLLALHLSTMAPDIAYKVATEEEFDTKVHIDTKVSEMYVKFQYVINSETVKNMRSSEYEGTPIWDISGLEFIENKIGADGSITLSGSDLITIKNQIEKAEKEDKEAEKKAKEEKENEDNDENSEEVNEEEEKESKTDQILDAISAIGMTRNGLNDAANICADNGGKGKKVETMQPFITFVEKAWYKNVYFYINQGIRDGVENDEWLKTAPDFDAYEEVDAGMIESAPYNFNPSEGTDQENIVSDRSKGAYQVIENRQNKQITQKSQPLKGSTNPRIKELFVGAGNTDIEGKNPKPEYYIFDGSEETAKAIQELRKKEEEYRKSGNYTEKEVSEHIKLIDTKDVYRAIDFNKNSLTALAILENMQTEDAEFILRDFKALLIELKYFTAADLADKKVNLLDWIIPDYEPLDWPSRKYEKQNYQYGTYIKSKKSMDAIKDDIDKESDSENEDGSTNETQQGSSQSSNSQSTTNTQTSTNTQSETVAQSGDGYPNVTKINNISYRNYKQYVGSYADKKYWDGTMKDSGCGPTAAAIVAAAYGKVEATPDKIADIMVRESTMDKIRSALATYGINGTVHMANASSYTRTAVDEIRASLNEGKPVIVLMNETKNTERPKGQFSPGGHFIVLLGEENGTLIMSNPGRGTDAGNKDTKGLEAFVKDYMTEKSLGTGCSYLILEEAPSGAAGAVSVGFESGMKVITPGIGEVTKLSEKSITIKFTETNLVKDMTMTISGFTVDSSISVGDMLEKEQEIGTTTDEDIILIFRAPNKSIIENIEDYMPPPNAELGSSVYYGDLTNDEFEFFATVLVAENGANEETLAAVAHVIKNRALDTVHFTSANTIPEVLIAPNQYGSVYKVPGSGPGPIPGAGEANPPAGARTFKLEGKGEYWVGNAGRPREATDEARQVAREVMDGTRPDVVSAKLGKKALFQVTLSVYKDRADSCCVALGELYSHSWGCLVGEHQDCNCTYP